MSASKNTFEEAVVFAEDLIVSFLIHHQVTYSPSASYARNRNSIRKHFNIDILLVAYYFSLIHNKPYYKANYFPRGYNVLDFLHFCGKVLYEVLRDVRSGIEEAGDYAVDSIASCLNDFIDSGEFESNGGWSELKDMCSKLCAWNVFCSVICIGNKYGNFKGQYGGDASTRT